MRINRQELEIRAMITQPYLPGTIGCVANVHTACGYPAKNSVKLRKRRIKVNVALECTGTSFHQSMDISSPVADWRK